jgi:hypothetical protein
MKLNNLLKPWIYENAERAVFAAELDYMWNTMEASGEATISDKYNNIEKIVMSFTKEYYEHSGAYEVSLLPAEILLTVWEHFGLDPYQKH